jgi:hypothetical protein
MLAGVLDPDGRRVILTEERWAHIKLRHPEVSRHLGELLRALREPDERSLGREQSEELFHIEWSGPGRRLRVVVHYEDGEGYVITAFPEGSA